MHMEFFLYVKKGKEPKKGIVYRTYTPSQQQMTTGQFQRDQEKGRISRVSKLEERKSSGKAVEDKGCSVRFVIGSLDALGC